MKNYVDLGDLSEDKRIETCGEMVTKVQKPCAMIVEDNEKKIARYCKKMSERYPAHKVTRVGLLFKNAFLIKVEPK